MVIAVQGRVGLLLLTTSTCTGSKLRVRTGTRTRRHAPVPGTGTRIILSRRTKKGYGTRTHQQLQHKRNIV